MSKKKDPLNEKLSEIYRLISECKELATENNVEFTLDVAYGMGGTYYPPKLLEKYNFRDADYRIHDGWMSSTNSCR